MHDMTVMSPPNCTFLNKLQAQSCPLVGIACISIATSNQNILIHVHTNDMFIHTTLYNNLATTKLSQLSLVEKQTGRLLAWEEWRKKNLFKLSGFLIWIFVTYFLLNKTTCQLSKHAEMWDMGCWSELQILITTRKLSNMSVTYLIIRFSILWIPSYGLMWLRSLPMFIYIYMLACLIKRKMNLIRWPCLCMTIHGQAQRV